MSVKDDPNEHRTYRTAEQIPKDFTVTELTQWCLDRDMDPDVVKISGGHFVWMRTETDEQRDKRLAWAQAAQERHEQWVREAYARLPENVVDSDA